MVVVPTIVRRSFDHRLAPLEKGGRMDRRELLHRLLFIVGKTLPGIEVLQTQAFLDFLILEEGASHVGLLGVRQGGMTALLTGALDERVSAVSVIDYFNRREDSWNEPFDRLLYGQLKEFGDAEIVGLIAPRSVFAGFNPTGSIPAEDVQSEEERARRFYAGLEAGSQFVVRETNSGLEEGTQFLVDVLEAPEEIEPPRIQFRASEGWIELSREAHFDRWYEYAKRLVAESKRVRQDFWRLKSGDPARKVAGLKTELRKLMGSVPASEKDLNPKARLIVENEDFRAYELVVTALDGVEAWGQLLVPKRLKGRAPLVIAQHGAGGRPAYVTGVGAPESGAYHNFAGHLAGRGYVVFAPFLGLINMVFEDAGPEDNIPLRQMTDAMNPKVRKAAALGLMRTAVEQAKLARVLDYLESLAFIDAERIGYYGLSYGGYSAIWMSVLEERIRVSINSGHFNDWTEKITNEGITTSFLRHPNHDYYNWNVLNRFTHIELIAAMWPRPVSVEYGEHDAVTPPGWHRKAWTELAELANAWNWKNRVQRDFFQGGHEIHGTRTFAFLDRWLRPHLPAGRGEALSSEEMNVSNDQVTTRSLDASQTSIIRGTFWVSNNDPIFSGISLPLSKKGSPGDILLRFGMSHGGEEIGVAKIPADRVANEPTWQDVTISPIRLEPGKLYHFEISAEWGWKSRGDHYVMYGPRPLGGSDFPQSFGIAFRLLAPTE